MFNFSSALVFVLPGFAIAQAYGNPATASSTPSPTAAKGTTSSTAASAVHSVTVGNGGLNFSPDSLTAAVGDQVEFHFASSGHSVVEGDFNSPCQPLNASAFYSGFVSSGSMPFTVTINSTDPIWFYCSQVSHCQSGMVGVINPPAGQSVNDFATAASKSDGSKSPAQVQGGVFAAASVSSPSSPSSSGTAAPSTTAGSGASRELMSGFVKYAPVLAIAGRLL